MKVGLDIFLQSLLNGLVMGGIYSLIAIGLTLVFGVMRIINVAHGEFIMVGMYLAYFLNVSLGLDPYLTIVVIVPIMFLFGMAFYGFLIKPAVDKPIMNQVMITIGFSIVLVNLAMFLLTADYRTLNVGYFNRSFRFFRVMVGLPQLIAFLGSLGATVALYWVLVHTRMGRMIRAVAQNRKAATLMGIDVDWVFKLSMGVVSCCAGVAGVLILPIYYVFPEVGGFFIMLCFVVIVLGGMGNFVGALVGGIIVGLVESIGSLFLPGSLPLVATYILLIIFLLVRPAGLFGEGAV
jgi:branched-chain amino acid transport system permease protein